MFPSVFRAALIAALSILLSVSAASAHAELVSAIPGPDDVVTSPDVLVLSFGQDLDDSRTSVAVRNEAGEAIAKGGEIGDTPRDWRLELPLLSPGRYEVRYTTFSAEDGELHRGSYSFTVIAFGPTPTATPTPTYPPQTSASPGQPTGSPVPTSSPVGPAPSPAPTTAPSSADTGDASIVNVAVPIAAGLVLVGALAVVLLRRRAR